ncbi:winged helix-turn-helix domain-containing protein [Photobacterium kagoshimensis]|uniref:winged helix-turn-helix domain-containing protein n=1 Tax=Photobacterium kagoshimensis TaxID=2910242 RepID=UPI003D0F8574
MLDKELNNDNYQVGAEFIYVCSTRTLSTSRQEVSLNRAERELLHCLITNAYRVVSFEELLQAGWPHKSVARTSLFQTIRNLRIKLRETEKGEFIEHVSSVGYQIKATKTVTTTAKLNENPPPLAHSSNKRKQVISTILGLLTLMTALLVYFNLENTSETDYFYQVSHSKKNSSIVYLTKSQDKLNFLEKNSNTYLTPTTLGQRLFFIAKMDDSYSVAYCDKNADGECIASSVQAIAFSHKDINVFWNKLAKNSKSNLAIPLLHDEKNIQHAAKSYNLYIDNGKFIPNLSQFYLQKTGSYNWNYTAVFYRKFNHKNRFIPLAFSGGEISLSATNRAPFIAKAVVHTNCSHALLPKDELEKLSDGPAGNLERRINHDYSKSSTTLAYILFRQNGLILWYSDVDGFFWFNKDQIMNSEFSALAELDACKDYLNLGVCHNTPANTPANTQG